MNITTEKIEKVIVFRLADEQFAVPVQNIKSIEKIQHISRVPKTASFIKGVINLRGVVTPIVDLRNRLGIKEVETEDTKTVIIVSVHNNEIGLIVDEANDVLDIEMDAVEPSPEVVGSVEVDYVDGVIHVDHRLLILLNLEKVLENPKN